MIINTTWDDGSNDKIVLETTSNTISFTSDLNSTQSPRTKTFRVSADNYPEVYQDITISQNASTYGTLYLKTSLYEGSNHIYTIINEKYPNEVITCMLNSDYNNPSSRFRYSPLKIPGVVLENWTGFEADSGDNNKYFYIDNELVGILELEVTNINTIKGGTSIDKFVYYYV